MPHGNSHTAQPFVRTCPSVLATVRRQIDSAAPNVIYKKLVTAADVEPELQPVAVPRNSKQVQNVVQVSRQRQRLSHDAVYNLMELSYDLDQFVHKIALVPNICVVCGHHDIISHCNMMLLFSPQQQPTLLSYDTTFCLGDFYVSVLLFRFVLFTSAPVIPLLFHVHDSKTTVAHNEFFEIVKRVMPNIASTKTPLVSDQEGGITCAISQVLPDLMHILGWNHVLQDVKRFARSNSCMIPRLRELLRSLMLKSSEQEYDECLQAVTDTWPEKLRTYYYKNIDNSVRQKLGKWIVGEFGCFDPYSGVTTNQSEAFNTVMKVYFSYVLCTYCTVHSTG